MKQLKNEVAFDVANESVGFEDFDVPETAVPKTAEQMKRNELSKLRKAEKEKARAENFTKLKAILEDKGIYDTLPQDLKNYLDNEGKPASKSRFSMLNKLFPVLEVGKEITLLKAMQETLKGKSDIDACIKRSKEWKISFKENKQNPLESVYVLDAYPTV